MTWQIFQLPKQVLHASSVIQPGWKVSFYLTTTSTPTPVYTTSALSVAHTQPVVADAAGVLAPIYLDPAITYKATVTDTNDTLVYTVDPVNDSVLSQATIAELLFEQTEGEDLAGVTPSAHIYIPGDRDRGDIRRYGVTDASSAAAVADAVQDALASHGYAFIPAGTWAMAEVVLTADRQRIIGDFWNTVLVYSGSGIAIDSDGRSAPYFRGFNLRSTTGTTGIRIGPDSGESRFSHFFRVHECMVNGRSTGGLSGGAVQGFTTAGIDVNRAYYGRIRDCDIHAAPVGIRGINECNGNFFCENSIRDCHRGIHMTDTTRNSDGCVIADNEIEGGLASNLYGIDIQGSSNMMIRSNRMEYSTNGTAHIFVHDGANDAVRHSMIDNRCIGNRPSIIIGDDSGSNRLANNSIKGGWYSSTITIGVDADYTAIELPGGRWLGGGVGAVPTNLVNNSTTSIVSILEDQATTLTLTGCTTSPTGDITWTMNRNVVTLYLPTIQGTSNTTAATLTTLPAFIRPQATRNFPWRITDNSATVHGLISIGTNGVITLTNSLAGGGAMTNGGTKGILSGSLSYPIA
jgi:hypothetical protein